MCCIIYAWYSQLSYLTFSIKDIYSMKSKSASSFIVSLGKALEEVSSSFGDRQIFLLFLLAYLSSYHEKAINALFELAQELPAICLPR